MPQDPRVAIVILNWNGQEFLRKFLPEVIRTSASEAKIIIADNASTDDSLNVLKSFGDAVSVIQLDQNYGFTGGYNRALTRVDADYYILLNSDVVVTDNWIQPVINYMDQHPEVAAAQPKIRSYIDQELLEHAGAAGGYIDYLGYPFCRGRIFNSLEADTLQYNDIRDVFWATGACMFIRAKDFHTVGVLDEEFFAHMEEIDLCWRLQQIGKRICVVPESKVFHVGGGTLPKHSPRKTYFNFRNNLMMLHKNLPLSRLLFVIPLRIILDLVAGLKFMFDGDFADLWAVIRAHGYFYGSIARRGELRKQQQRIGKGTIIQGIYNKSLVKEYYLQGNKKFSQMDQEAFS
ncbi:glycosyltransferase family 2 protein [soil metagenome]